MLHVWDAATGVTTNFPLDGFRGYTRSPDGAHLAVLAYEPFQRNTDLNGDGGDFVMHDVSFNNGHGADSDPNLDAFVVSAVNGNAVLVGSQFTLASGALPTVNADDSYTYNPNGAFESDISVSTHSRVARACRRAPSGTPHRSLPLVLSRGQYGVT